MAEKTLEELNRELKKSLGLDSDEEVDKEKLSLDYPSPESPLAKLRRELRSPTSLTEEQKKEREKVRSGETITKGTGGLDTAITGLQRATKGVKDVATGEILIDPIMKATGLDEESAEEGIRAARGGVGVGAGMAGAMPYAQAVPHPLGKAAVLGGGALIGRMMADSASGKPTTGREAAEAMGMALGGQSALTTLGQAPTVMRLIVGGAEAATINELTLQTASILEEGKPLPSELTEVWDRNKLALGLGALLSPLSKVKPTPKQIGNDNLKVKNALREKMQQAQFMGKHASTKGRRNSAKELAERLKKDIALIDSNPKVLIDNSDPQMMQRVITILRNKQNLENSYRSSSLSDEAIAKAEDKLIKSVTDGMSGAGRESRRNLAGILRDNMGENRPPNFYRNHAISEKELLEYEIKFLNSLSRSGNAEEAAASLVDLGGRASSQTASKYGVKLKGSELVTEGQNIERMGEGWLGSSISKYATDPVFKWAMRNSDTSRVAGAIDRAGAKISTLPTPMVNRLYMGTADILERAAQKGGAGEKSALFQLAKGLRHSVDDGNFLAADYQARFLNKAEGIGYGLFRNKKETELANKEFSEWMRRRHSETGGVRGDESATVRTQYEDKAKGLTQLKINQPAYLHEGQIAENMRVARSKDYYTRMSPMGKALVDGWSDASQQAGLKMRDLNIIVKDGDSWRKARQHEAYWPRKLKQEYEELIEDNFRLFDIRRDSKEAKELLRIFGAKDKATLEKKLKNYVEFKDQIARGGGSSNFFSHLERGRTLADLPPEALDFSPDLGAAYLDDSARSLAQIRHFGGQDKVLDSTGRAIDNPDFIFRVISQGKSDRNTKKYVDDIHKVIFSPSGKAWHRGANQAATFAFIANPSSAIKNLTGAYKTWTITGTEPMARATIMQLADTFSEIGSKIRGNKKAQHLAERLGATGNDIGRVTAMVDSQSLTKGSRAGGQGLVGKALRATGFSAAEDFVRKQGTVAADLARREWMDLYDEVENAEQIVYLVRNIHSIKNAKSGPAFNRLQSQKKLLDGLLKKGGQKAKNLASAQRFANNNNIDLSKVANERFANVMGKKTEVPFNPEAHEETRRLLQSWTKETQGGYRFDQLPLYMQDDFWRTVFKFQNWGQQMQRHLHKNIMGELENGNAKPFLKWLAATQLAGETVGQTNRLFGRDREDASYEEIAEAFNDDAGMGMKMLANRAINNAALGGQWDLFGEYIGGTALRYKKIGTFDPVGVPLVDLINQTVKTTASAIETGASTQTLDEGARIIAGLGSTVAGAREIAGNRRQDIKAASKKLRRFVNDRFMKESLYAVKKSKDVERTPTLRGSFSPTQIAADKSEIVAAIEEGDAVKAKLLADQFIDNEMSKPNVLGFGKKYSDANAEELIKDIIKSSVKSKQPLRVGTSTSKEAQDALIKFMRDKKFAATDEVLELQRGYVETAVKAGLMDEPKEPTTIDIAVERERTGKYGTGRRDALVNKFIKENKDLLLKSAKNIKGGDVNEAVVEAARKYAVGSSKKLSPEENLKREEFYRSIIERVKSIAASKNKEAALLGALLPEDFGRIQNSWDRGQYLKEHFKGVGDEESKDVITELIKSGAVRPKDYHAFRYLRDNK